LAAKLGLAPDRPAMVLGVVDDPALSEALHGADVKNVSDAHVLLAVVHSAADLDQAVRVHAHMRASNLWVVHLKGAAAAFGDTAVRQQLRAQGYRDNKTCAVSERYTATRYGRG
jgi:hypothetical protein